MQTVTLSPTSAALSMPPAGSPRLYVESSADSRIIAALKSAAATEGADFVDVSEPQAQLLRVVKDIKRALIKSKGPMGKYKLVAALLKKIDGLSDEDQKVDGVPILREMLTGLMNRYAYQHSFAYTFVGIANLIPVVVGLVAGGIVGVGLGVVFGAVAIAIKCVTCNDSEPSEVFGTCLGVGVALGFVCVALASLPFSLVGNGAGAMVDACAGRSSNKNATAAYWSDLWTQLDKQD